VNLLEVLSIEETIACSAEAGSYRSGAMACPQAMKMRGAKPITASESGG
jgi:hypothetical protein